MAGNEYSRPKLGPCNNALSLRRRAAHQSHIPAYQLAIPASFAAEAQINPAQQASPHLSGCITRETVARNSKMVISRRYPASRVQLALIISSLRAAPGISVSISPTTAPLTTEANQNALDTIAQNNGGIRPLLIDASRRIASIICRRR